MWPRLVYTKDHCRKPVWLDPRWGLQDAQGAIPGGWCSRCGAEVFRPETELCIHCEKWKGESEDGAKTV